MTTDPSGPLGLSIEDFPGPACLLGAPDGRIAGHNAAFAGWAGREDVRGVALADLLPADPGAARLWPEARAAGEAEHHVERRGPDGETSFWSLRARRTPSGVLVCAGDLTAFARAAHAVHAAERDYVAVAAHELRAPLSAIKAWASALDGRRDVVAFGDGDRGALAADALGAIARQVDRMNDLLTHLFEAARAGAGALRADRAPVGVEALVSRALAGSPHAARVTAGALPGEVVADAAHVEAILARVVGWIAARAPAGPIALRAVIDGVAGGEVHLLVDDPGPAIPRGAVGEIFGRSLRSRAPSRSRRPGLGLYLCQQLAAANGGRIFRERAEGDGGDEAPARFVLALPRAVAIAEAGDAGDAGETGEAGDLRRAGAARVVVGEPDPERRARAVSALRLEGHEAVGVADGDRLFEVLAAGVDVGVVDLLMPGLSPGAVARIRASPDAPAIVVLAPPGDRPEAFDGVERAGALAVLGRPLDWPHLISLVGCVAAARGRYVAG